MRGQLAMDGEGYRLRFLSRTRFSYHRDSPKISFHHSLASSISPRCSSRFRGTTLESLDVRSIWYSAQSVVVVADSRYPFVVPRLS